jgi:hypothetical protein
MNTEIKLFVGVYDTDDLPDLFQQDAEAGFGRIKSVEDAKAALSDHEPPFSVVVHGGMADRCVAELIKLAIDFGATRVQIPLAKIRTWSYDAGDGNEATQNYRKLMLQAGLKRLNPDLVSDERIVII